MLNLVIGVIWLLLAAALLGSQLLHSEEGQWTIGGTGISFGWIALVLALYNLVRWWSRRAVRANEQTLAAAGSQRRPHQGRKETRAESTPDPNFNFTDQTREPPAPQ